MKKLFSLICVLVWHYADAQNAPETLAVKLAKTERNPVTFHIDIRSGWPAMLNTISDRDTLRFPPVQNWTLLHGLQFTGWESKQKDVSEKEWRLAADSLKKNTWGLRAPSDWGPAILPY